MRDTVQKTYWLASYPKSGNTWFRIFLANLLYPEQAPVSINSMPLSMPIASNRAGVEQLLGTSSAFLTRQEAESLRIAADKQLAAEWKKPLLVRKSHDTYTRLADGRPLMGEPPDYAVLFILRHPWDVAISAANHWNCSIEEAARRMANDEESSRKSRTGLGHQFPQRLLSWQAHAISWLRAPMELQMIRYEAMQQAPLDTFRKAVHFLGLDHDDDAIETALSACAFERMQAQEQQQRFHETPQQTARFFRGGRIGDGRKALSKESLELLQRPYEKVEAVIEELGL
jgi:aryl sulfotransferase